MLPRAEVSSSFNSKIVKGKCKGKRKSRFRFGVTETKIQASFDRLCEGRTSIIIAHRLSTIRNADRIAVIDREQILEQGSHQELMALHGEYAALVTAQQQIES